MARNADGVFTRKDRAGFYISYIDAQGTRRKRKTDAKTITQAKLDLASAKHKVREAKALGFSPPAEDTFAAVADRYLTHQRSRLTPRAYERERGVIQLHLKPAFTGKVKSIRRLDVQRYLTTRCGEVSAETARKELNILKHLLKLACEWEIIPSSPAVALKSPKAQAGRMRYLQPTELNLVVSAAPEWLRPIIQLAVFTGMRRSEILGLRWLDLDLRHDRILLPQTKNGDGRIVYLNRSAGEVLAGLLREDVNATDPVFPDLNPEWVSLAFLRACRRVKIHDFRFHDLRHTAASWMRMRGADIHTVAQILGHKDLRMAARYQHLSPAFLAEAVAKLDEAFPSSPRSVPKQKMLEVAEAASA